MLVLPSALNALAQYPQFICYYVGDDTNNPGKLIKMPLDYRTGRVANAHDSNIWTDFETASRAGHHNGHGVGFVLTRDDPFFFIDIDSCYDEQTQQWAPTAQRLLAACAGAAVEVSSSGRGLHIIGKGTAPTHRCKNELGGTKIEMYTEARFIALTGTNMIGNAETDLTDRLPGVVDQFFPLAHGAENGVTDWTNSSRTDWCGPTEDSELVARAIKSRSARSIFGNSATFADLWHADTAALGKAFPANNAGDPYDASSADAALAQHLAFWTGCNCERIKTLMMQSALVRPKWQRESYINTTIQKACARQTEVFKGGKSPSTSPISHSLETQPTPTSAFTPWHEVNIADILTNPPLPPRFLIESLLPAGVLTLLGAHGGTGKSMLSLQAAVCLATGQQFMGKTIEKKPGIIFLCRRCWTHHSPSVSAYLQPLVY
jgi:primase-polymerase (primpol)-like protein